MKVAIIDYGSGNLRSAAKAFERAAADLGLSADIDVTGDADVVRQADRIVLPGVGAFGDCRRGLDAVPGMVEAMEEAVHRLGRPFLGICVGMQLLADRGLEHGVHAGLGWIPGDVAALTPTDHSLKIPHMGWNNLEPMEAEHPVIAGIRRDVADQHAPHAYFVHSFGFQCAQDAHCLARIEYGGPVTAIIGRDTIVGTQFHPEKSQAVGLELIARFLQWAP